ncbi:MAG: helix-turn-helix domain-containing protein [Halobacteria archaeon]
MAESATQPPEARPPSGGAVDEALRQRFQELLDYSEKFFRDVQTLVAQGRRLDLRKEAKINSEIARRVTAKWSVEILYLLYMGGPMGFENIRKTLGTISSKTLSERLKTLERLGYVERSVQPGRPIRVRYSLTDRGRSISTIGAGLFLYLRHVEGRLRPV